MFLLYALIRNHSARNFLLAAASLVFYALGEPVAVLIMLLSIGLNYLFGLAKKVLIANQMALLGANAILDSLGRPHDDRAGAPEQVERTWRGDLEKLLLPAGNGTDDQIVYEVDHAAFRFTFPPGVEDHQAQLESFMSDREERDMSFGVENTELGDGSRLFMARDSFGRALLPWMIDSCETSFFRRTDAPDPHDLAPGTEVVFEIVERNLGRRPRRPAHPARRGRTRRVTNVCPHRPTVPRP